ncbi:MAG TPA: extracellular solute-binding protein [Solirubrobacterales bacterium]|nr:extracellular solute-binding protein [Solirubrobacterales bacterium]
MLGRGSLVAAAAVLAAIAGGCGGSEGNDDIAPAPNDPNAEVTGELRVFAYEDSVVPELLDPVTEANPGLEIKTATFDSNEEAAAKLAGGFEADVVEICLDEMKPLVDQSMLRPLDVDGLVHWDDLNYTDAEGIVIDGDVYGVPLSAGLEGLVYNPDEVPGGIDELADLWDPQFKGRATIPGSYALIPLATAALAIGIEDPMNMSAEDLERAKQHLMDNPDQFRTYWGSDSDLVNLFKSGEVVVASAGPQLADRIQDANAPAKWAPAKDGTLSWVCGFAITSKAQNIPAAYALMNWQSSPEAQAIRARDGYLVTNREALDLAPKGYERKSGVDTAADAIPETYPPSYRPDWVHAWQEVKAG